MIEKLLSSLNHNIIELIEADRSKFKSFTISCPVIKVRHVEVNGVNSVKTRVAVRLSSSENMNIMILKSS